jgi:hypothetical protein
MSDRSAVPSEIVLHCVHISGCLLSSHYVFKLMSRRHSDYFISSESLCIINPSTRWRVGRDSSVGIATRYGLDGPGIESRWDEIFRTHPDWPWGPPSLLYNGYRVIPGGKVVGAWRWPPTPI